MLQTKLIKRADFIIKLLIILLSFGFIVHRLFFRYNQQILHTDFFFYLKNILPWLSLIFMMMFMNWLTEAYKWKYLIRKIENVPLIKSFMAVWAAINIGLFTPNRAGENIGRAFILEKANRWEGIFITFIGSLSQLLMTLFFGNLAAWYFLINYFDVISAANRTWYLIFCVSTTFIFFAFSVFYFQTKWLKNVFKIFIPKKFSLLRSHIEVFDNYNNYELMKVLMLSLLRYMLFSIQYYLLLKIFDVSFTWAQGMIIVSLIYLVITVVPSFMLTDISVRGSASILVVEMLFYNQPDVVSHMAIAFFMASFVHWFINLVIPAIVGAFFVFRLKFFR